jgi:HAMP domain-containing protein
MIRTIRFKMLMVIAACMAVAALALGWYFNRLFTQSADRLTREAIRGAGAAFGELERTTTQTMSATLLTLARDPDVRVSLASRDPVRAMLVAQPLYRELRSQFGITHWNWWEPEDANNMAPKGLRNILRVGTPDMHGDFVERITLARVARERRLVSGLDLGFTGLVLRTLVPVEDGGRPIGYLELGKEISGFLGEMKRVSGNEYGLVVEKKHMDEKKWTTQRGALGFRNNWNDMPDLLVAENTTDDPDVLRYDGAIGDLPDEGRPLEVVRKGGRALVRGVFPIRDVSGRTIGGVFVLRDVTGVYGELRAAQVQAILGAVVLMIALGAVLVMVFQVLVVRRLNKMIRVATRVVGGEFETEIVPSGQDELGEFETLFEQFRMLFVELIKHAQRPSGTDDQDAQGGMSV